MKTVIVLSFPGSNCEVETVRALKSVGLSPVVRRWNETIEDVDSVDAYILPGGFSYEDRGRSGLIASRQSVFDLLKTEAQKGKPVIGICNGAQMLVESGMVPFGDDLDMSLAQNILVKRGNIRYPGFMNKWVHMKSTCAGSRCPVSNWTGIMHVPIANGEGRFTTRDPDVIETLTKNDQIVFSYCDAHGEVGPAHTPNGSQFDIAGICNPAGNVVALMPHPERSRDGLIFFNSLRDWLVHKRSPRAMQKSHARLDPVEVHSYRPVHDVQVFIDTTIINNEERTLETVVRAHVGSASVTQMRFYDIPETLLGFVLASFAHFNPNKEVAYIKRGDRVYKWDNDDKLELLIDESPLDSDTVFLRVSNPDPTPSLLGHQSRSGVCYAITHEADTEVTSPRMLSLFYNPHAASLAKL